jgi:hypothetical protein
MLSGSYPSVTQKRATSLILANKGGKKGRKVKELCKIFTILSKKGKGA